MDEDRFIISDYCSRGSLSEVLHDKKLKLRKELNISLSLNIAQGMAYLHNHNFTHGNLRTSCCLVNQYWTVKIADWEFNKLYTQFSSLQKAGEDSEKSYLLYMRKFFEDCGETNAAYFDFWLAPEILSSDHLLSPTSACDVYSFAIIMHEIFTREEPYSELSEIMSPKELLEAIKYNGLRPEQTEDIPVKVHYLKGRGDILISYI